MISNRLEGFRCLIAMLLLLLAGCGGGGGSGQSESTPVAASRLDVLWDEILNTYLADDLWTPINNYDAANVLMFPMHFAFSKGDLAKQDAFNRYFERYAREGSLDTEDNNLRKLQYLYLQSQYLKLVSQSVSQFESWQDALLQELRVEVEYQWNNYHAWNYGDLMYEGGMKERFADKLSNRDFDPEYAGAIFDEEFFLLAIAADLIEIAQQDPEGTLLEIQAIIYEIFVSESVLVGDGWLFQPGIWSDHRDYRYAGHSEVLPELTPAPVDDIASDSSHLHRMPLWLLSFRDAYADGRAEREFFQDLYIRLRHQFETTIFVSPDQAFAGPRLNNYADGRNGVYRYNYDTVTEGSGYGPYGLSAVALPLGWYVFLQSDVLLDSYRAIELPMSKNLIDLYVGPNTTRERHPLVKWPDYFNNGFAELHLLIATQN